MKQPRRECISASRKPWGYCTISWEEGGEGERMRNGFYTDSKSLMYFSTPCTVDFVYTWKYGGIHIGKINIGLIFGV